MVDTFQLGDFAISSDLPRLSSPGSPLPVHSASAPRPPVHTDFGHYLLSNRWSGSQIWPHPPTLTHICIHVCYQDPSTETKLTRRKCRCLVLTICLTRCSPTSISTRIFSKRLNSVPTRAESSGLHQNHGPMWTGFRNEHGTNDIPDLETGSIPQGINCVPGKAAPKGRKRWRPRTREERSQINWMKRGGGPYYWRDLKSFQELKDDQKRKGPSCSSPWQEHSWTKCGPCISQPLRVRAWAQTQQVISNLKKTPKCWGAGSKRRGGKTCGWWYKKLDGNVEGNNEKFSQWKKLSSWSAIASVLL